MKMKLKPSLLLTPAAGTYSSTQSVTISGCPAGDTAAYTTDGGQPTIASAFYSWPITVSANTTIKALCFLPGLAAYNIQNGLTGWKCVTPSAQTYGSLACQAAVGSGLNWLGKIIEWLESLFQWLF